jgi:RNA polymerase sigma-70 factor, ECF subfamily
MDAALETLVERIRESEADDIDELLHRVRPLVYRWVIVQTADADEAEDITQKVLMRVHAQLNRFRGRSLFTTWLYRVTVNAIAEDRRSRGIWKRFIERWRTSGLDEGVEEDVLARIEDVRARERLRTLLRDLTRPQRALVDLVDLQEFTPAEAAAMLDMNANTARVHLMRARRILRTRILAGGDGQ